jgi:hypothetical protein
MRTHAVAVLCWTLRVQNLAKPGYCIPESGPEQQKHGASCCVNQLAAELLQGRKTRDTRSAKTLLDCTDTRSEGGVDSVWSNVLTCLSHPVRPAGWHHSGQGTQAPHKPTTPQHTCSRTPELVRRSNVLTQTKATAMVMAAATWSCCRGPAAAAARLSKGAGNADGHRPGCCVRCWLAKRVSG